MQAVRETNWVVYGQPRYPAQGPRRVLLVTPSLAEAGREVDWQNRCATLQQLPWTSWMAEEEEDLAD